MPVWASAINRRMRTAYEGMWRKNGVQMQHIPQLPFCITLVTLPATRSKNAANTG